MIWCIADVLAHVLTCSRALMCSVFELIDCLIVRHCWLVLVCELAVHTCYRLHSTLLSSKKNIKMNTSDELCCVVLCADWVMKLKDMRRLCDWINSQHSRRIACRLVWQKPSTRDCEKVQRKTDVLELPTRFSIDLLGGKLCGTTCGIANTSQRVAQQVQSH